MSLIKVTELQKHYTINNHKGEFLFTLKALDDVSFDLEEDSVVGVVGESGCGKSTLGKTVLLLEQATSGSVEMGGVDIFSLDKKALRKARKDMQMIFQDPYSSLNKRKRIYDALSLPLRIHHPELSDKEEQKMVDDILKEVGLDPELKYRYPHQFSGGQRQRIAIARALIINPKFIVADECVSALDVSIQAQILNLLKDLKKMHGFTCMFISHDLRVVEFISDVIMVMYMGKIVETAKAEKLEKKKLHPYTQLLFNSHPSLDLKNRNKERPPLGEPPNYKDLPKGCAFYGRCPHAMSICKEVKPDLQEVERDHRAACWLYENQKN